MDQSGKGETGRAIFGAIEALSEGLAVFDAEDTLVLCNGRFRQAHPGLDAVLKPGMPWSIFRAEAQSRGLGRGLDELDLHLASGADRALSVEASRPGGRWARLGLHPTEDRGFVLTLRDITESVEAAELRAEADERLRQVLDACGVNIMMCRVGSGAFLYRNPACHDLFGDPGSAKEIYADPGFRSDFLAELLATGAVDDFEVALKRADGGVFPGRVTARLVDYGGEDVIVSSTADMTQLYAQRDELARQREARFQNEKLTALGELLAGVAHELNNPLSVVVGQALMLREEALEPDLARRVGKISTAAERCAKIVKTFLAMARQKPARLEPVSLNAIVETAADVAGYGVRSNGGALVLDLHPAAPMVTADEDQISQVVVNLLVNADQATRALGAEACVRVRTRPADGAGMAVLEIEDNGPGIAREMRARVFEPFFTTKAEGAGIGLALCHRIVTGHSGALGIGDAPGGGARLVLTLPSSDRGAEAPETPMTAFAPSLRALVVDDEKDIAEMLADMLGILGIEATCAHSAEDALSLLARHPAPDLILSDLRMPGMGGDGLLRALRKNHPALARRFAFLTGDAMETRVEAMGRPKLEKPVAPHELRALLQTMLHGKDLP